MPRFQRIAEEPSPSARRQRVGFDERFLANLISEDPLDRVESEELRRVFMAALADLSPDELKVVEMRFQHKKSPGQTASRLRMDRDAVAKLESSAVEKLRRPIAAYMES